MPLTDEIKRAALVGLRSRRDQLDTKIVGLERELRSNANGQPSAPKKRVLSAAGRKRIAEAQRKRWAALRAEEMGAAPKPLAYTSARTAAKQRGSRRQTRT